jgi:SAM-dependent methyltransferase
MFGAMVTAAMISACELGVFQRLARGPATVRQLAQSLKVKQRGLTMLLDALVATGQLTRCDGAYGLPPRMQAILSLPGVEADTYFTDLAIHAGAIAADWMRLAEVIRSGEPIINVSDQATAEQFFQSLVRSLFPNNYLQAQVLFGKMKSRFGRGAIEVLDVAAGAAPWSMPFVHGNPSARATAVDFPAVLEVARHFARAFGVEDRYTFQGGDIGQTPFGSGRYDLALLGHICHSEGPKGTARLFRKVARALKPGGVMIVADFVADEDRCGADGGMFALLFALNMLVHTREGATFTLSEYQAWADAAGFRRCRLIEIPGPSPLMLFER